jgi:GNAT superfamily N-acetyltransferase
VSDVIRLARPDESSTIAEIVDAAYSKWISVIGRKPVPMLADYPSLIQRGVVYVLPHERRIAGVLVIWPQDGAMLIENVAVHPDFQKLGIGRKLLDFAEQCARETGLNKMALYTNEKMVYNQQYYGKIGYSETKRELTPDGRRIVWMHKTI